MGQRSHILRRANKYRLVKDEKRFLVKASQHNEEISLVSTNQVKRLINASKKFVMLILKATDVKASEAESSSASCSVDQRRQLDNLVLKYQEGFLEPKGLPPKRPIEHEIQLLSDLALPNLGI